MMSSEVAKDQGFAEEPKSPASLKQKRLSNGNGNVESPTDSGGKQKNGIVCNGASDQDEKQEMKSGSEHNGTDCSNGGGPPVANGVKNPDADGESVIGEEGKENLSRTEKIDGTKEEDPVEKTAPENDSKEPDGDPKTDGGEDCSLPVSQEKTDECKSADTEDSDKANTNDLEKQADSEKAAISDKEDVKNKTFEVEPKTDRSSDSPSTNKTRDGEKERSGRMKRHDSDDIQIVGESKVVNVNGPYNLSGASQNVVFVPAAITSSIGGGFPMMNQGFAATNVMASSPNVSSQWIPSSLGRPSQHQGPGSNLMVQSVAPPQPKSSLDQIELIRWEIHNRINTRPKYFKPNTSSELGPLAKFLFDIGSDLIKETVYHELVKIQSKKGEDDKLSEKEKDDLDKLKEIEKDLHATIGHLKFKMKKRCNMCSFHTESASVLYTHKQFPHEDNKKLHCSHCNFVSKQPMAYKFHIEAEHNIQPRLHDKKAFYECDMCPYENNQEQKVEAHKQRCLKQFRPLFNLHPSCLSGAEINLCLENIFYKPVVPKNLKLLQQKHAQQQAALLEAKRQQAQVQALAAQKNAAAAARKQQQLLQQQQQQLRQSAYMGGRTSTPMNARMPQVNSPRGVSPHNKMPHQPVRQATKAPRPTVANMLNNRQIQPVPAPPPGSAPGNFEVCEICGGYVKDRKALRIHFFYAHRIDLPFNLFERSQAPLYCATCYVRFWTAQGLRKHIDTHKEENITQGVVGKCISCGHHVLNLLIHMRIVHNREIQHYVNALMCMFCGSSFNSRSDVERHIKLVHGIVDTVTGAVKAPPGPTPQTPPSHPNKGSSKKGASGNAVKGSVCVLCNLNFGRNVDLTRHCMRMHHTCMKCGMVVIDKASLMKHTCLASPSGTRDCCMCSEKGFHPAYYVKHLRDKHLKKFSVKVGRVSKFAVEKWTKRPYPFQEKNEILVEISDSEDDVPLKEGKAATVSLTKKPKIGPAFFMRKQGIKAVEVVTVEDDDSVSISASTKSDSDAVAENVKSAEQNPAKEAEGSIGGEEADKDEGKQETTEKELKRKASASDEEGQSDGSPKRQKQS